MAGTKRNLWDAQEAEREKNYHAFCHYRDLPSPERSVAKAYLECANQHKTLKPTKTGRPSTRWLGWSSKFRWVERAEAYDRHIEELKRKANEGERIAMAERHAKIATGMLSKLVERVLKFDTDDLRDPADMAKWLEVCVKVERLSRGEPTDDRVERHADRDGNSLFDPIEELRKRIGALTGKVATIAPEDPKPEEGAAP